MRFFTLHERPGKTGGDADLLAVKTGFSWWAAIMPPLWLLRHRLWLGLVAYLLFSTVFGIALELLDVAEPAATAIGIALSLLIGAMAHDYRRWTLGRHGWRMVDVLRAEDAEEAEIRYYRDDRKPAGRAAMPAGVTVTYPMRGGADAFPRLLS